MTNLFRRFVPHPFLTVLLTVVWMMLQNQFSYGMVVFGMILGILIPLITSPWWPDSPRGFRFGKMVIYGFVVLWDIIVANLEVAWIVLTVPNSKLRPAWIVVPLDIVAPEAITMLAGTITLTPGTVTADLSNNGKCLLVHVLHTHNPDGVRDDIKSRYEARLKEIFV